MSRKSQLLDLVVRWEDLRAGGAAADPEDLCRDCPELLEELRQSVQAVAEMDAVLYVDREPNESGRKTPDEPAASLLAAPGVATGSGGGSSIGVLPGYEILEELGRGGMGVVYKARQIALERIVALKTLLPHGTVPEQEKRRFLREAKIMALLQHPNIVQIHEVVDLREHPQIVMEYVPGGNLSEKLGGKPLPPRAAAELAAVLARTVQAAHHQGVVHRDLKPTNVLLTAEGTPKICDFGVAKWFDGPGDGTQTGQLMGTPSYMAPEQLHRSQTNVGPTVDVYALGALLYELLTGRPPFLADK
jgi:serine/threonine-protein kinase